MNPKVYPVLRRAILDQLCDVGGEQSDQELTIVLTANSHPATRREVNAAMRWLAEQGLVTIDELGSFLTARLLEDGQEVSMGRLVVDGVGKIRSSDFGQPRPRD